jgi:uncharacterized protein related to proFAR isomerase
MSGPALKQLHAHRSIHDGALSEGKKLTTLLNNLVIEKRDIEAGEVADALIEHWETRTIAHADAEEEGFYKEKVEQDPSLTEVVTMLKRDHAIVRILVDDIKIILAKEGVNEEVLDRFRSVAQIVHIHSREEEKYLLE